jgi:hypothetical protein
MTTKKHASLLYLIIEDIILFVGGWNILFPYLLGGSISVILNSFLSQIYYSIIYLNLLQFLLLDGLRVFLIYIKYFISFIFNFFELNTKRKTIHNRDN